MFKKMISFTVRRDASNAVIDTLSRFGECGMHATKDNKSYDVTIVCEKENFRKCLDSIMLLCYNDVLIWNMDIKMVI